jgi:hypothetical protein
VSEPTPATESGRAALNLIREPLVYGVKDRLEGNFAIAWAVRDGLIDAENEARALLLDELEAAVRERIDTIGVERGRAHAESKHDYEAGVEFAHNLFVGLLALIQQHREAIR